MASNSPQRPRKSQLHQTPSGPIHNIPPRDKSLSPSFRERSRTIKAQAMPQIPTTMQIFSSSQQPVSQGPLPSPTNSTSGRRSPQLPPGHVQRSLPTPPHPNAVLPDSTSGEQRMSPPPPPQHPHNHPNVNYPRPVTRVPPPPFLTSFQTAEDNWQMTEELLAEIERADKQAQAQSLSGGNYQAGYPPAVDSPTKDAYPDRLRHTGKASPKEIDRRRQREAHAPRGSPKTRERHSTSPLASNVGQNHAQSHSPEENSPSYSTPLGSPGEHPGNYFHSRRTTVSSMIPASSLANQTPPLQNISMSTRTPDKSLPVQEEPEEDVSMASRSSKDRDPRTGSGDPARPDRPGSPTPSPDLHPESHSASTRYDHRSQDGRSSRAGHRDEDDDDTLIDQSSDKSGEQENDLHQNRPRGRSGATDQLGLRSFDAVLHDQQSGTVNERSPPDQPPQYAEYRKPSQQHQPESSQPHDPRVGNDATYYTPVYPDDLRNFLENPTSAYLQSYLSSPRPDAPIPPTPHSQISAPSPSPLISGHFDGRGRELPPFSPVVPSGSPYPYPFTHVRRNHSYSGPPPTRPQMSSTYDPNLPSVITEQMAKQYQIYAQNHLGHISDSTLSPSSTPYPRNGYFNQWAQWHTHKLLHGHVSDPRSITSSPSHEPVSQPKPPAVGLRKKVRTTDLRQGTAGRKPPPRVESTQPRETSPEPSSSGESTAGEEHFAVAEEGNWVGALGSGSDDMDDWVDDDEEDDDEDLLDLEFHPTFVNNIEKRQRRWQTRWDSLIQAFQALDRQTDATLVLMAAPSHSTKLHLVTSRSVRRQPALVHSPMMTSLRAGFRQIATQRRKKRAQKLSLADRFLASSNSLGDGSDITSEMREEDLKRALGTALRGLEAMGGIYDQREARWREEMQRISEDRERIELFLKQAFGDQYDSEKRPTGPLPP